MIRFRKRPAPPKRLPEEVTIKRFWSTKDVGGVIAVDDMGKEYEFTYSEFLEHYEVE
jgi:hypothetical protein